MTPMATRRKHPTARPERYVLRLFVTGMSPRSSRAITNARLLCEQHLPDGYDLDIVDLYQDPARARSEEIIAAPTLVRRRPLPLRRLVGDLSDTPRVLRSLGLARRPANA
jgi:circadian clock protein KaiB